MSAKPCDNQYQQVKKGTREKLNSASVRKKDVLMSLERHHDSRTCANKKMMRGEEKGEPGHTYTH
jgi:hypothetical protein